MLTVIIGVVALAGGFAGGFLYRKKVSEKEISSAEEEGRRIVNEAIRNAESKKKEALLEAKEEILKSRTDYEKEEKSRRADLQRQENRLQQKEENLDRKLETIEKKEESLAQKHAAMEKEQEEIRTIKQSQTAMLEKISGFTADEAKEYLIQQVESEVTHETALKIKEVESRMKEECERLQYTVTPCPRTVTGFCRCFAFRIGKIHYHHCIVRNFQFRKFLPVQSNIFMSYLQISYHTP